MSQLSTQPAALPTDTGEILLRATNIRKSYRMGETEVAVLKDVNLSIRPGEFIAIEGRSGSGKSTLLHVLASLEVIENGQVIFDGQDYTRRPPAPPSPVTAAFISNWMWVLLLLLTAVTLAAWIALQFVHPEPEMRTRMVRAAWIGTGVCAALFLIRWFLQSLRFFAQFRGERASAQLRNKQFGFVFQFYYLLPELNVLENTMLAPMIEHSWLGFRAHRTATWARATKLLEQFGMGHRLKHRSSQLSGGERQRVAIARALMNNPRILFADEPTGNLDTETGRQIMDVLEKLHRDQGQTIVMVTHDRSLAVEADRVMVLKDGILGQA